MGMAADEEGLRGRAVSVAREAVRQAGVGGRAALRGGQKVAQAQWAYRALASVAPPAVPVGEPWKVSVGTLLGRHPRTPGLVRKALGLLDGFGAVELSQRQLGFDGEAIDWDKVIEIRTRNAFEVLTTSALEHDIDRVREFLPPVPGRKWAVTKAAEALTTVMLGALEEDAVGRLDGLALPSQIVYRGLLGRERTLSGGSFAVASLVIVEAARESLLATAEQRGVPVVEAEPLIVSDEDRAAHVQALRRRTDAVAARLRRLQAADGPDEAEGVDGDEPGSGVDGEVAVSGSGDGRGAGVARGERGGGGAGSEGFEAVGGGGVDAVGTAEGVGTPEGVGSADAAVTAEAGDEDGDGDGGAVTGESPSEVDAAEAPAVGLPAQGTAAPRAVLSKDSVGTDER
ncbi:hypothetical protein [Actinacidiphila acididurans]|uniref:DUF222 domain-containing protein n=1 Tax=Actinacidiphila acididurans TaxID=2784346 RepID=A0ABS2TY58_9ACTN|nr:hypothetical protein [Actinacidiphila acididurans]MBM9507215.1 hypothetical protein [Actinacidiphila acididurans]